MWASLNYPPEADITIGENPIYIGDVFRDETRNVNWSLVFSEGGIFFLDVKVWGYKYYTGEYVEEHGNAIVTIRDPPPLLSILSPENITYLNSRVPLTFTVNETTEWIGYSIDGLSNVTITGNMTLPSLSSGLHHIVVYGNDSSGSMGVSNTVSFTISDIVPPVVSIISPMNITYWSIHIPLTIITDESVTWLKYSLDGQANVTLSSNTTLSNLEEGYHNIIAYASDLSNNLGTSGRTYFSYKKMHDIGIVKMNTSKSGCFPMITVGKGYNLTLYVTVENQGSFNETFTLTAYANSTPIGNIETTLLAAEVENIVFIWNTSLFEKSNYTLTAQVQTLPNETDTEDNLLFLEEVVCVTISGDIDGDRDIDIFDISRMASRYNLSNQDPDFDLNSDIDGDGDIDIFDIVAAARFYGQSW